MKLVREGPPQNNIVAWVTYRCFWECELPHLKVSKRHSNICNLCFVFANQYKYCHAPCFGDTDSLSSVSSNIFSVVDEFRIEEDMLDGLGDNDDGGGISVHIEGLGGVDIAVGDSSKRKLSVVTPELINKAVRHVRTAKAQRHYLRDSVTAANLDSNINATHYDKHYVFICDYAQSIELPFLGYQQPGEGYYLSPNSVYVFGMVNMAHKYNDVVQSVGEHLYTHVYFEKEGDKGSNNVASLIMKTLTNLNILRE